MAVVLGLPSFLIRTSGLLQTRNFVRTAEHHALKENLIKLIDKEINPHCEKWEKEKAFPAHKVFKLLGSNGYLGISKPVEYGGMGLDISYEAVAAEAYSHVKSGGVGMGIGIQCDIATPAIVRYGSEELKEKFVRPTIAGDSVACLGVSEVGGGSDVAALRTTARLDGDEWVINGGKMWTTNGAQADWMCLLANTSTGDVHRNKSLFCLPMNTPGVKVHRVIDKLGMHASDTAETTFENARIPKGYLIGEEGKGFIYQMQQFQNERIYIAAGVIAALDQVMEATIEYTSQRQAFGKSILDNQYVHYKLAEMQTELELVRALYNKCIDEFIAGEDITPIASMLKLKSSRLAREISDGCLQFWGGMGFTEEVIVSRSYRDLRLMSIGGGADEVMLNIICKFMGIAPGMR